MRSDQELLELDAEWRKLPFGEFFAKAQALPDDELRRMAQLQPYVGRIPLKWRIEFRLRFLWNKLRAPR